MFFSLVGQDPLELLWIEKQATIFLIIVLSSLPLLFLKELFHTYLIKQKEKRVRDGITSLFLAENINEPKDL